MAVSGRDEQGMDKSMKDSLYLATLFFVLFSFLHMISDLIHVKLPFLASSEAVWEHIKIGFYAALIAWPLLAARGRKAGLIGLAVMTLITCSSIFLYYYSIIAVTGPLSSYGVAVDLAVTIPITWFSGFTGAVLAMHADEECIRASRTVKILALVIVLTEIWLTIATTYWGVPLPLFTLKAG